MPATPPPSTAHVDKLPIVLLSGVVIGVLGGMIGLGGAEFRLPLLIGLFGFVALEAVILNKATSLVVVISALIFRGQAIPFGQVLEHWPQIVNLLGGSLAGAWFGAAFATRLASRSLYRVIAVLLLAIAVLLLVGHESTGQSHMAFTGVSQIIAGIAAGLAIGFIASLLGVAGGEFLIPTFVLLFGIDIKLAGSLSLAVSLPTMLVGFARYSQDRSFTVVAANKRFVLVMAIGSMIGTFLGGLLLQVVPAAILLPFLALILVISAVKIWRHQKTSHS